ncbi:MAG TPA: RNA-binding S4 domain-containing protein [Devosiaceae bacterium]|jgi:ribosome-associated heat shock protein Hsp15
MADLAGDRPGKQRLDKWLFFSRAVKSRTLAQKLVESGAVRVNAERTTSSDHKVGAGDVLTFTLHTRLLVWRIRDPGERRGPAPEAVLLYEDLSPAPLPRAEISPFDAAIAPRAPGSGRPTKKQRRETDRLHEDDE